MDYLYFLDNGNIVVVQNLPKGNLIHLFGITEIKPITQEEAKRYAKMSQEEIRQALMV